MTPPGATQNPAKLAPGCGTKRVGMLALLASIVMFRVTRENLAGAQPIPGQDQGA